VGTLPFFLPFLTHGVLDTLMSNFKNNQFNHTNHTIVQYDDQLRKFSNRNVPIHLNWKGMFHDSNLLVVSNTEAEAVDGLRDNLHAEHATTQSNVKSE